MELSDVFDAVVHQLSKWISEELVPSPTLNSFAFVYPNQPTADIPADKPHVVFFPLVGETMRTALGTLVDNARTTGILRIQINVPRGSGTKKAGDAATFIRRKIRRRNFDRLFTREASLSIIGPDGPWWRVDVTCPLRFEQTENSNV
jgi:hypothetical protein